MHFLSDAFNGETGIWCQKWRWWIHLSISTCKMPNANFGKWLSTCFSGLLDVEAGDRCCFVIHFSHGHWFAWLIGCGGRTYGELQVGLGEDTISYDLLLVTVWGCWHLFLGIELVGFLFFFELALGIFLQSWVIMGASRGKIVERLMGWKRQYM